MEKLAISDSLLEKLRAIRGEVRGVFTALQIDGHSDRRTGRQRLEAVPALRRREFEIYLLGSSGRSKQEKAAWLLFDFIATNKPLRETAKAGLRTEVEGRLNELRLSQLWLDARVQLGDALGASAGLEASATMHATAASVLEVGAKAASGAEFSTLQLLDDGGVHPRSTDMPAGKSTGRRENHVDDLCYAEAEWRDTNLAPGEGRWLQLLLNFKHSYTRDRGRNVELNLFLHRVRVEAMLDGGQAAPRSSWIEPSVAGTDAVEIFQGNAWTGTRPCYDIDNPVRSAPLSGRYGFFDLFQVTGEVGNNSLLEISASIGGISASLPKEISEQLDPNRDGEYKTPELHLIEAWLRNQLVPKSRLKGGGRYQLAQIELIKVPHDE